jgi:hypothetical protein
MRQAIGRWDPGNPHWLHIPHAFSLPTPLTIETPHPDGPTHPVRFGPDRATFPAHRDGEVEFLAALETAPCACPILYRDFQHGGYPFPGRECPSLLREELYTHLIQPYLRHWTAAGFHLAPEYEYWPDAPRLEVVIQQGRSAGHGPVLAIFTAQGAMFPKTDGIQRVTRELGRARPRGDPKYANSTYGERNTCRVCDFHGDSPDDLHLHVKGRPHFRNVVDTFLAPFPPPVQRAVRRLPSIQGTDVTFLH